MRSLLANSESPLTESHAIVSFGLCQLPDKRVYLGLADSRKMSYLVILLLVVVVFSHQVVSDSLTLYGLQYTIPPYPSLSPRVCPSSCPLSQECYPTISFSANFFSFCPQSFPASGSFHLSLIFTLGGQNIGASASASVLPLNIQGWFPLGLTILISLQTKGHSKVFSSTTI